MSTRLGIVGLPNIGKSTLFNALTRGNAQVAPYPFTTTDPNVGIATVDDARLAQLARIIPHDRIIPTSIEFVDIAGLIQGAHEGEGLGNQFLSHIFAVDALLHVVRCFDDPNIPAAMEGVDPIRDVEVITTELLLKDLEMVERRLEKERKLSKGGEKKAQALVEHLDQWKQTLEQGIPLRQLERPEAERPRAFGLEFLTEKPVIYIANVDEASLKTSPASVERLAQLAARGQAELIVLCAKLEGELAELDPADQATMRQELGVVESALPRVVKQGYHLLNLLTFFTTASRMIQAWTVAHGTKAPQAAGTIHTDFERQFVRAEVISVEALVGCGGETQAKTKGLLRVEGKEYVVKDGDVMHFRLAQP